MRALVTGAAGFLGSHLAERLVADGHEVRGVDCFTPYYDRGAKEANIAGLVERPHFELVEADLRCATRYRSSLTPTWCSTSPPSRV